MINVADGNDMEQLRKAFAEAKTVKGMPVAIIMKTLKGKGVSFMEDQAGWHGKAPNDAEYAQACTGGRYYVRKQKQISHKSQDGNALRIRQKT